MNLDKKRWKQTKSLEEQLQDANAAIRLLLVIILILAGMIIF